MWSAHGHFLKPFPVGVPVNGDFDKYTRPTRPSLSVIVPGQGPSNGLHTIAQVRTMEYVRYGKWFEKGEMTA